MGRRRIMVGSDQGRRAVPGNSRAPRWGEEGLWWAPTRDVEPSLATAVRPDGAKKDYGGLRPGTQSRPWQQPCAPMGRRRIMVGSDQGRRAVPGNSRAPRWGEEGLWWAPTRDAEPSLATAVRPDGAKKDYGGPRPGTQSRPWQQPCAPMGRRRIMVGPDQGRRA